MEHIDAISADVRKSYIDGIAELIPGVITESENENGEIVRSIDFDLLRQELEEFVVDGPRERYQLDWPGKRKAILAANAPISKTLRPVREESVDFDNTRNLFIEGDNLEALKILQESYLGKVDVIYIDPPYNTGNDFVYDDDFAETTAEYLERSGQSDEEGIRLVSNSESNGRFHSDWLSMMYSRLKLSRSLLKEDGVIMVAIGDHEHANLRSILDNVFGSENFLADVVWQGSGKNDARFTAGGLDYMLIYARSKSTLISKDVRFRGPKRGFDQVMSAGEKAWQESGHNSALATAKLREWWKTKPDVEAGLKAYMDIDASGRLFTRDNLRSPNPRPNLQYPVLHPITAQPVKMHPNGWVYSKGRMEELLADERIIFGPDHTTTPRFKRLLSDMDTQAIRPVITQERAPASDALAKLLGGKVFDHPKDLDVLSIWFNAVSGYAKDSIFLDFFAGSGTTGHAVMELNAADGGHRRFILVQLGEAVDHAEYATIADIARERLRRAGVQIQHDMGLLGVGLDVGFRSLHVATSNLVDTLTTVESLSQGSLLEAVRSVKPDRNSEDLLFQVLLDWGLDLTEPLVTEEVEGARVHSVAESAVTCCFSDNLPNTVVREIASRRPLRAVFLDSAFKTDAERINVEQIFRELSPDTQVRVI